MNADARSPASGRNQERLSLCRIPAERGGSSCGSLICPPVPH